MKIVIIGARSEKPGLGSAMIREFENTGHQVIAFSRDQMDISQPSWMEKLAVQFVADPFDVIVLNAFDFKHPEAQRSAFISLYEKFKDDANVQLVIIGSMTHYFITFKFLSIFKFYCTKIFIWRGKEPAWWVYRRAEWKLNRAVLKKGKVSQGYSFKLLLFEPGILDNQLGKYNYSFTYSTTQEAAQVLRKSIEMNSKFIYIAIRGSNKANII